MAGIPPQTSKKINTASSIYAGGMAAWNVYKKLTAVNQAQSRAKTLADAETNGYRPEGWSQSKLIYAMTDSYGNIYIFDAVLRVEHDSTRRATEHPVQNRANIVDHSFQLPDRVSFEIGMSDAMDSYIFGQWQETSTKSVSAFQKLKEIQQSGLPVTLLTRLNQYANMIIENIHAPEDHTTVFGLKCQVQFREIPTANVNNITVPVSALPDTVSVSSGPRQAGTDESVLSQGLTGIGVQ